MNKCQLNVELSSHEGTGLEFNRSKAVIKLGIDVLGSTLASRVGCNAFGHQQRLQQVVNGASASNEIKLSRGSRERDWQFLKAFNHDDATTQADRPISNGLAVAR